MNEDNSLRTFLHLENVKERYIVDLNTEKQKFSYEEVNEEIERLISFFKSINVQPGEEISILLFNSIEYVVCFLGVNYNKNICLPLNTNLKKEEYVSYLVNNCKYIIIHDYDENNLNYSSIKKKHSYYKCVCKSIEELGEEYNIGVIKIKKNREKPHFTYTLYNPTVVNQTHDKKIAEKNAQNGENKLAKKEKDDFCLHLHTSGTTSKVKIVQLTNRNIKTSIVNITSSYGINKEDNTVVVMPLYHVHGLIGVLMPILYSKGNVLFQVGHSFSASEFWSNVVHYNITYFSAVPTILKILLIRYESDYFVNGVKVKHKLRFIRTSSSQLDEQLEKEIEKKFETNVLQAYGMTEACHQVSANKFIFIDENNVQICKKYKSVGIPNVGVVIYNHEKKKICDENELGEICINGKNIMYGYKEMKDNDNICVYINTVEEKTHYMGRNKFLVIGESVPFFKTGDVGYVDAENFLFISGRIKEIINRGGEKIIPNEIDNVLRDHPLVADCLTFSLPDEVYGEIISTAVILDHKGILSDASPRGDTTECAKTIETKVSNSLVITTHGSTCIGDSFNLSERKPIVDHEFNVEMSRNLNLMHFQLREELIHYMKKNLADFKIPKNIYFVNNFLKTDTGKLSRRKVTEGVENMRKDEFSIFDVMALALKKFHLDDYIYGLYGIPVNKMIYSFIKNGIYYISFRNEINASLSCNYVNYFDLNKDKKKIGIILTCSGPAFVNTLPGLYNAMINRFPIIYICFENFIDTNLTEFEKYHNFQYFPQFNFLKKCKEICAKVYQVDSLDSFIQHLYDSVRICMRTKSPVYINLNYKLIEKKVTIDKAIELLKLANKYAQMYHLSLNVEPSCMTESSAQEEKSFKELLESVLRIYECNKKGVIFLGTNCNYGVKYVLKLSLLLKIPIYTSTMAKCFIKENYMYNANQCKSYLFENIDFCFSFGTVYNFYFNFGKFPNCKKENMLCVDLKHDTHERDIREHGTYEHDMGSTCNHFFFTDLNKIMKRIYFSLKKENITVNVEDRMMWLTAIGEAKQKNIHKICTQVATKHFSAENFTMEEAILIIRHFLIEYLFARNDIPSEYKKYFINYLKYVDRNWVFNMCISNHDDMLRCDTQDVVSKGTNRLACDVPTCRNFFFDSDQDVPQNDCDLSDSSSEDEEKGSSKDVHVKQIKQDKTNYVMGKVGEKKKNKFLTKEIKKRVIITNEGSITLHLGILYLPKLGPYNFVIPQINGMMGVSMNAAICAALNNPKNVVFSILGDSSFGFTSNEVETICRLKLKVVLIIFNNNGIYGDRDFQTKKMNFTQMENHDIYFYLQNPSALYHFSKYENYVTSHGGYGRYVDNREEFIRQMKIVTDEKFNNFPVLLNVIVHDSGSVKFDVHKYIQ
ncbi:acyl-CoA synthetase [Plasmodium gonderi]|uniref:Acyl-CoA synthetase n=1 Tax=Plasmodium gonderi TaxID=77519 RepID=A0A1Y1JLY4_PLAGO|nr:acyl-CoA synthetase [Plasmodium gonderi]GAW81832.1 acyl-CoA synthetase [Plasmodium gonderi]